MRLIGYMESESHARSFGDYLYAQDVENSLEEEGQRWAIWVHGEDHLDEARQMLEEFLKAPDDRRYARANRVAREKRERDAQENEAARKRYFDRTTLLNKRLGGLGTITAVLLGLSLLITLIAGFGRNAAFAWFTIVPLEFRGGSIAYQPGAEALLTWQAWRWFTPMFVHMTFLHLFLNLWWLKDLGSALESYLGRWTFLGLVLLISGPANMAQFLSQGPLFGGMSGVVYGLLGYIWIRGKLDPFCGLFLHPTTVTIMAVWFVLCLFGVVGNIANVVHAVGLGMGVVIGALAARRP